MKKVLTTMISVFFVLSLGVNTYAIHEEIPAETQKIVQPRATIPGQISRPAKDVTVKALINLLEKKGVIDKKELREEIERLKKEIR